MAHDTRWKPGQSGNPAGRPKKGQTLAEILATVGDEQTDGIEIDPVNGKPLPNRRRSESMARTLWNKAIGGDVAAAKLILERLEGRPTQKAIVFASHSITDLPLTPEEQSEYVAAIGAFFGTGQNEAEDDDDE